MRAEYLHPHVARVAKCSITTVAAKPRARNAATCNRDGAETQLRDLVPIATPQKAARMIMAPLWPRECRI
jgi:hypothetical protein